MKISERIVLLLLGAQTGRPWDSLTVLGIWLLLSGIAFLVLSYLLYRMGR